MTARIGHFLRRLADRIDHDNAPRTPNWCFRFEMGKGIVWGECGPANRPPNGCRVWYFPADYDDAWQEG